MILMVVLCKFYFAFIHSFLVKKGFFIISVIAVVISDLVRQLDYLSLILLINP